jgi:hypothetical protein
MGLAMAFLPVPAALFVLRYQWFSDAWQQPKRQSETTLNSQLSAPR